MDPEEQFPPRPGGMVDTARKAAAQTAEPLPEVSMPAEYPAVRVKQEPGNLATARILLLSAAQQVTELLPRDLQRRTAVVLAVDNDVLISPDQGTLSGIAGSATATSGGFYLPAGIAIPVDGTAQMFVACTTTATSSRVSVLVSRDST